MRTSKIRGLDYIVDRDGNPSAQAIQVSPHVTLTTDNPQTFKHVLGLLRDENKKVG